MKAVLKKELNSYLGNWMSWTVIAVLSIITALFLFFFENEANIFEIGDASMQGYFGLIPWLLMFIIPALTMRSFAEETQQGTLSWLFSVPVPANQIVGGKFLAVYIFSLLCMLPSLVYFFSIYALGLPSGNIDFAATLGSYFGVCMLSAAFAGLSLFASALTPNLIASYLLGVFLCFILFFGLQQLANYKILGAADYFVSKLGMYEHYTGFSRGLLDSGDIFYFVLVTLLCLFGSVSAVNRKKLGF